MTITNQPEFHERQFRGTWAPVTLHDLVEKGEISALAAWLAMVIDSLSKTERGCYASNKFLAEKIHKSESRVKVLLAQLEKSKILVSEWNATERRLWIDWNCRSNDKRNIKYQEQVR